MKRVRSAKIVILDGENRALLLRRSKTHPQSPLKSDLPGGIVEAHETIEVGLIREVYEETGLDIIEYPLTVLHSFIKKFPGVSVERVLYGVRLHIVRPDVVISWEHDTYKWVSIQELDDVEEPYQSGINIAHKNNLWVEV